MKYVPWADPSVRSRAGRARSRPAGRRCWSPGECRSHPSGRGSPPGPRTAVRGSRGAPCRCGTPPSRSRSAASSCRPPRSPGALRRASRRSGSRRACRRGRRDGRVARRRSDRRSRRRSPATSRPAPGSGPSPPGRSRGDRASRERPGARRQVRTSSYGTGRRWFGTTRLPRTGGLRGDGRCWRRRPDGRRRPGARRAAAGRVDGQVIARGRHEIGPPDEVPAEHEDALDLAGIELGATVAPGGKRLGAVHREPDGRVVSGLEEVTRDRGQLALRAPGSHAAHRRWEPFRDAER